MTSSSRVTRLAATDADLVLRVSPTGRLLAASDLVCALLGDSLEACTSGTLGAAVVDEAQRAAGRELFARVLTDGSARMTLQASVAGGTLWVDVSAKQLRDEPGCPVLVMGRDVTDDVVAATQLAASEQQWRVAFEHSPIGGALLDVDGAVLVVNEALSRMTGWSEHELTRMDVTDVVAPQAGAPWADLWASVLLADGESVCADRMLRTCGGGQVWGRLTAAALGPSAAPARVVLQVEDVTSRREAELELANRALHDGLTGAPNRFLTRQWLASALEDNPGGGVGVLYCDVDRFKVVNDSLGHAAGDDLLTQVAERLRQPLRPEDLLGRVGGDEFVVILEGVGPAELAHAASRLASALDEPFELGGHRHAVTLSLGGAVGADPDTADEVLMRADLALLRAKRLGRARYVAFDPAVDRVATRADLQLEDELRTSLQADEVRAYYQPVVALDDLAVVGHEALIRWEHPVHGLLRPDRFLELAESSGLIRPLGAWMLAQACRDASAGDLPHGTWVAVNASPSQLTRPGVAADIARVLADAGLPPERLHLEVTETALITATTTLADELRELAALGVRIALDDFGTGYSSLSLLRHFPVDTVKIDMTFVSPLLEDRSAHAIVKAVLGMCADLGLQTVAEGIETQAQLDLLREMGCSHGQGYLFGRPAPLEAPARLSAARA
jgi:diguanylate cyclase (GGDEF)-like protein/PAS domain S-box-containing protein